MNNKAKKLNLIFCGIAFAVMLGYMFFADGESVVGAIGHINIEYLLLAVLFMLIYWLLEAYCIHSVLKPLHEPQKFKDTVAVTVIGQYFNCITPSATGGQPIQAYYMVNNGVPLGACMTALLSRFIVYQFVLTIYTFVLLLMRLSYFMGELELLSILAIVGFAINLIVLAALLMLAYFKRMTMKFTHWALRLLARIKIVKQYKKRRRFMDEEMEAYHRNFHTLKKRPLFMLKLFLCTVVQLTVYYSVTYVIYLGFGLDGTDYLTVIACQSFVMLISGYVPLPGAAGAAEGTYGMFFGGIFGSYVTLSTFIWRFLTFYFTIISGMIITAKSAGKK